MLVDTVPVARTPPADAAVNVTVVPLAGYPLPGLVILTEAALNRDEIMGVPVAVTPPAAGASNVAVTPVEGYPDPNAVVVTVLTLFVALVVTVAVA
jgi:hypothetical protein